MRVVEVCQNFFDSVIGAGPLRKWRWALKLAVCHSEHHGLSQKGRGHLSAGFFRRLDQHVHHQRRLPRHRPCPARFGGAAGLDQHRLHPRPDHRHSRQRLACCLLWQQNRVHGIVANFFMRQHRRRPGAVHRGTDRLALRAGPGRRLAHSAGAKHDLPVIQASRAPRPVLRHHAGGLAGARPVARAGRRHRRQPVVALDFLPERAVCRAGAVAGRLLAASRSAARKCPASTWAACWRAARPSFCCCWA